MVHEPFHVVHKTFWSELRIVEDDVEWHSYEEISTETAQSVDSLVSESARELVGEMKRFIADFERVRKDGGNDLDAFWLRKTKKVCSFFRMI